jgi:hypothetical protein
MLKPVCNTIESDRFFQETSIHYQDILNTYKELKGSLSAVYNPWTFVPLYDIEARFKQQIHLFEAINDNLYESEKYTILTIGISSLTKEDGINPHFDDHPTDGSFKRLHLALQLTPSSRLLVLENEGYKSYEWELGRWVDFQFFFLNGIKHTHYPINLDDKDRIVLLVDVFIGKPTDEDLSDYYKTITGLGWLDTNKVVTT